MEENSKKIKKIFNDGNLKEALKLADEILNKDSKDFEAISIKAKILSLPDPIFNNPGKAIALVASLISKENQDDLKNWVLMADVLNDCGEYCESAECYRRVLDNDPDNYESLIGLASLGDKPFVYVTSEKSEKFLIQAITIQPENYLGFLILGDFYKFVKKDDFQAIKHYEISLEKIKNLDVDDPGKKRTYEYLNKVIRELGEKA